jgi:hypothetical protein
VRVAARRASDDPPPTLDDGRKLARLHAATKDIDISEAAVLAKFVLK